MMDYDVRAPFIVKPVPGGTAGVRGAAITMYVKGAQTGEIKGGAPKDLKGAADHWQLIYSQHAAISPRDPQSGLPTGQRMHLGVEVVGRNCKGVPLLWNSMCTNETLTDVKISFWSQHAAGSGVTQKVYYTVELENANVATMEQMTSEVDGTLFFRARFTWHKITWTWLEGGLTASDKWEIAH